MAETQKGAASTSFANTNPRVCIAVKRGLVASATHVFVCFGSAVVIL